VLVVSFKCEGLGQLGSKTPSHSVLCQVVVLEIPTCELVEPSKYVATLDMKAIDEVDVELPGSIKVIPTMRRCGKESDTQVSSGILARSKFVLITLAPVACRRGWSIGGQRQIFLCTDVREHDGGCSLEYMVPYWNFMATPLTSPSLFLFFSLRPNPELALPSSHPLVPYLSWRSGAKGSACSERRRCVVDEDDASVECGWVTLREGQ
jgi:hypothetical protein